LANGLAHRAHDTFFRLVHGNALIYNTCWEDPRLDRELLCISPGSRVVTITSAGCNALDYLLDGPARIHAVDVNPRQNALLELKMALLRLGDHGEMFRVFGEGVRAGFGSLLRRIADALSPFARTFWTAKHGYFEASRLNPSFYYRGAAGQAAWMLMQALHRGNPEVHGVTEQLFGATTIEEQRAAYERLRPSLWNSFNRWLVRQPLTLAMMGVPRPQMRLIEERSPGGIAAYVQEKLEHVLTSLPMADNYFWRVYATGRYTRECCPNYLRQDHFAAMRERLGRLSTHTMTMSRFLGANPGEYSHFVLLDHQDWLASHDPAGLEEEWSLLLRNSRQGTRILMRSASPEIDFIPAFARQRLRFFTEWTERLHRLDRVGTYGSTLLAEVM
jgi:S-adenosylmethionine-diacylglycerol 3-amino-3-carboxypropyl transferase